MPLFSIARHSKIYPNWDFWFENKASGNTVCDNLDNNDIKFGAGSEIRNDMAVALALMNSR
jgi:hypothetical protein